MNEMLRQQPQRASLRSERHGALGVAESERSNGSGGARFFFSISGCLQGADHIEVERWGCHSTGDFTSLPTLECYIGKPDDSVVSGQLKAGGGKPSGSRSTIRLTS